MNTIYYFGRLSFNSFCSAIDNFFFYQLLLVRLQIFMRIQIFTNIIEKWDTDKESFSSIRCNISIRCYIFFIYYICYIFCVLHFQISHKYIKNPQSISNRNTFHLIFEEEIM